MVWNTALSGFQDYATGSYSGYPLSMTAVGGGSYYAANFPTVIPAGVYNVLARRQLGANPGETDLTVATGEIQWGGAGVIPLSDLATSGQVSQFLPTRVTKGHMLQNFPIYLKQAADHITPLTSGIVSGQICRNSGVFGPLQSGSITELGQGFYTLLALTSGDTNADTFSLLFTGVSVSGVASDPLPMSFVTQRG